MVKIPFRRIGIRPSSNLKWSNEIYKTRSLQICTARRNTRERERGQARTHTHICTSAGLKIMTQKFSFTLKRQRWYLETLHLFFCSYRRHKILVQMPSGALMQFHSKTLEGFDYISIKKKLTSEK